MDNLREGQKWISTAEPELGMGRIIEVGERTLRLAFDLVAEERTYASTKAPLTRVRFKPGDEITTLEGQQLLVERVDEDDLLRYHGRVSGRQITIEETQLDPNVSFSKPEDRLFTFQLDDNAFFNLRYTTHHKLAQLALAPSRGLYGPRVSLIPHQLYIGHEVARRYAPRVLLADEVGLGKTIEAGLIIHQQLLTGRASRVLVLVPPALTFQWFVEMVRRFNLHFTLLDAERCNQISADNALAADVGLDDEPDADIGPVHAGKPSPDVAAMAANGGFNPFEAQQLVLCNLDLLTQSDRRLEQALDADWDLVVVDEAHHLQWTPTASSDEYRVVEQLGQRSKGLLLLTATPEQLGPQGHFARLRLLDPARFANFDRFAEEQTHYEEIAQLMTALQGTDPVAQQAARTAMQALLDDHQQQTTDSQLIDALLDRHGTGRVLFRNARASVSGFPRRITHPSPLSASAAVTIGYFPEQDLPGWPDTDPRIDWLVDLVMASPHEKFLLICAHQDTVLALETALKQRCPLRLTLFHEGMDLIARDRAASYFADTDRGAQLMLCSEIGSEGRNFQFASHLVLFDLPLGPDLLEQRIGRLDRIGQARDVNLHVPYLEGSRTQQLFQWYQQGLALFHAPNSVAQGLFDELLPEFERLVSAGDDLEAFIARSRTLNDERQQHLQNGRDQLLELNSHRPAVSRRLAQDIQVHEGGLELEDYMEQSFDIFGLESEPLDDTVLWVKPGDTMERHVSLSVETQDHYYYPELPEDGLRLTFDRDTALVREDVLFMTWEHPLVQQALDRVVTDVIGNSTIIAVKHPQLPAGTLLLETLFIADCSAPRELMADRYLPPLQLRQVISPALDDISVHLPWSDFEEQRLDVQAPALHSILSSQREGITRMLDKAKQNAGQQLTQWQQDARLRVAEQLGTELDRLEQLARVNNMVRPEEIDYLRSARQRVLSAIEHANMRLDAVRVIVAA